MPQPCSLYLVRHAIAEERGADHPDDSQRPLTGRGTAKFRKISRGFARLDPDVNLILTSPLVRARQTADILAHDLRGHPAVVETAAMTPSASFTDLLSELGLHSGRGGIALVGHEPSLSAFAARLVAAKGAIEFKKGGVARIDVEGLPPALPGRLVWLVPPRLFAGLGR